MRGTAGYRIARPAVSASLAEIGARLARRQRIDETDRSLIAARLADLRRQYSEQLQRAKSLFSNPRLKLRCCSALLQAAVASAKVSRMLYETFRETESALRSGRSEVSDPEAAQKMIAWNRRQLDRLEDQIAWLDSADALMPSLAKLARKLETARHTSASEWQDLARRFLADARSEADVAAALPFPGFSLRAYLTHTGAGTDGEAFGRGIETARILARFLIRCDADALQIDLLMMAALCQDCGVLLLSRPGTRGPGAKTVRKSVDELHASIGAALVGGLTEVAADLPLLVAEHHRRLREPNQRLHLGPAIQKPGSRLLAAAVRFLEIREALQPASAAVEVPDSLAAYYPAAIQLLCEAERGEWDAQLAAGILAAIGFQVERQGFNQTTEGQCVPVAAVGIRRFDHAQPHPSGPKLSMSRPVHGSSHVQSARDS